MDKEAFMKKLTAFVLVLACVICLTGCAAARPQSATNPEMVVPTTTPATAPSTTSAVIPTTTQSTKPDAPENLTLRILVANDPSYVDFRDREQYYIWELFARWCTQKNLTIEWTIAEKDQYREPMVECMVVEKEAMPDAFWCDASNLTYLERTQLVDNGRIFALEDILPYSDGTASGWFAAHPDFQNAMRYKGKTWWVGAYTGIVWNGESTLRDTAKGVTFRLDWYNQLVQRGAWDASRGYPDTAAELGEFLELCNTYDVNRNGMRDEYYLSYISDMHSTGLGNLFGIPRDAFAPNLITETVDTAWTQPGSKELMELLIDWYNKGYFPADMIGGTTGSGKYRTNNQTAVYSGYFYDNWSMRQASVPSGAASAVLCGVIPDVSVHPYAYIANDSSVVMDEISLCFTTNLSHPAAAAALLDIICSEEYANMIRWGTDIDLGELEGSTDQDEPIVPYFTGAQLFGKYVLPTVSDVYDLVEDENCCIPENSGDPSGEMHRVYLEAMTQWQTTYPDVIDNYLALPEGEEVMTLLYQEPVFQELSREIFLGLVTGEISMDEWDACIDRLNREGYMSEIQAVYQARFDRYLGK